MFAFKQIAPRVTGAALCGLLVAVMWVPGVANAAPASSWAVVNSAGTLVRGHSATAATKLSTGTYEVDFAANQTGCAYSATPGDTGAGAVSGAVSITVASRAGNPNGLFIQTFNMVGGAVIDAPFHVSTYCGTKLKYAVVSSAGVIARGAHTVSSAHLGTGNYEVIFDAKLKKCTFNAVIGTTGIGASAAGTITLAGRSGNTKGVFIHTMDGAGTATDYAFHLVVDCGKQKVMSVIESSGAIARGQNIVSATKLGGAGTGVYEVIFNRNVSVCEYNATVGVSTFGGSILSPVVISTASRAGNINGVFIFIHSTTGATIDEPFHLTVAC